MLYSILQIIAFQALFLLVYDLFLKRETFFNYNRGYLIITSVLSFVLPFLKFPELKTIATKNMVIHLPEVFIGTKSPTVYDIQIAEQAGIILEQQQTPIWQLITVSGIVIASLIFLIKIAKLYWIKHKNPKRWNGNILIVSLIKSSAAFSFFNTIFLGERIADSQKPIIYEHELVHIKEYHTIDLLFFELLRIVFWFNPLVYIYQNRIKELHEYIADATAVKQSGKTEYYKSLLNQILDVNHVSFTNTFFNKSLIKKRIAMLQKSKSKQFNLVKYALLIPMVFAMLIYTSTEVRAQKKTEIKQEINQELTDAELIKKYYDEFVAMDKRGATFFEISDYAGLQDLNLLNYIPSRIEFIKTKAFGQYISDKIIESKTETLYQSELKRANLMRMDEFKTYDEFKAFKNTKEEKQRWETTDQDGVLKLYVADFSNMTDKEQSRYDALIKQVEEEDFIGNLIILDDNKSMMLDLERSNEEVTLQKIEEDIEVPFSVVEESPTTVECNDIKSNKARKNCISTFINKHIGRTFNTGIADSLSPGKKRIIVMFKIDKDGTIKDIKARGPSEALEVEAKRVIATLPQFIPGKQKGKLVVVPYSIPIIFQVAGEDFISRELTTYEELVAQRDRILKNSSDKNPAVIKLNHQIEALKKNSEKSMDSLNLQKTKKQEEAKINQNLKDSNESEDISFSNVNVVPVHPDCNSIDSVIEKKNCFVRTINKHVGKNFNTAAANSYGLKPGKKRISVRFVIDKKGNVTNIVAEGPHKKLEEEVVRVLQLLPKFTPGMHREKSVDVSYSLPIVFQINEPKKNEP